MVESLYFTGPVNHFEGRQEIILPAKSGATPLKEKQYTQTVENTGHHSAFSEEIDRLYKHIGEKLSSPDVL